MTWACAQLDVSPGVAGELLDALVKQKQLSIIEYAQGGGGGKPSPIYGKYDPATITLSVNDRRELGKAKILGKVQEEGSTITKREVKEMVRWHAIHASFLPALVPVP